MRATHFLAVGMLGIAANIPTASHHDRQVPSGIHTVVLLDIAGDGIKLSGKQAGVVFTLRSVASPQQVAWTLRGSDDGFLVFDSNRNGKVDSVSELVGSECVIDSKPVRDGAWALLFPLQGVIPGADGRPPMPLQPGISTLDSTDARFGDLRIWQDINHDGVPAEGEVKSLVSLDISAIGLGFQRYPNGRPDSNGNVWFYEGWFLLKKRGVEFRHGFAEVELGN